MELPIDNLINRQALRNGVKHCSSEQLFDLSEAMGEIALERLGEEERDKRLRRKVLNN